MGPATETTGPPVSVEDGGWGDAPTAPAAPAATAATAATAAPAAPAPNATTEPDQGAAADASVTVTTAPPPSRNNGPPSGRPRRSRRPGPGMGGPDHHHHASSHANMDALAALAKELVISVNTTGRTVTYNGPTNGPTSSADGAAGTAERRRGRGPGAGPVPRGGARSGAPAAPAEYNANLDRAAPPIPPFLVSHDDLLKLGAEVPPRYTAHFKPHLEPAAIQEKLAAGELLQGTMRVDMENPSAATVAVDPPSSGELPPEVDGKTITLAASSFRNRAYEGDTVAVAVVADQKHVARGLRYPPKEPESCVYAEVVGVLSEEPPKREFLGTLRSTGKIGKFISDRDKFVEFWPETRTMPHALVPIGNVPDKYFVSTAIDGKQNLRVRLSATVVYKYWDPQVTMPFGVFEMPPESAESVEKPGDAQENAEQATKDEPATS